MAWNRTPIRDEQWKPPVHSRKPTQALEQDHAAGGHRSRRIMRDTNALGRVVLRRQYHRIYAELRWQVDKIKHAQHLGGYSGKTRAANLAAAWQDAHGKGLTACSQSATEED